MVEQHEPLPEQPPNPVGGVSGTDEPNDGVELAHPSIQYERRDVPFRWVLVVAIAFVFVGGAIFMLVYAFFRADTDRVASRRESEFPLAEHPSDALPVAPRLEEIDRLNGLPQENVYLQLLAKETELERYGKTSEKGFVHIPISRAMESLAGHLPVRKQPPTDTKDNGLLDSGASNSGRMFRGAPQ
jgi:hypothetical protein